MPSLNYLCDACGAAGTITTGLDTTTDTRVDPVVITHAEDCPVASTTSITYPVTP